MILYKVIKEADKSTPFSKAVGAAQVYFIITVYLPKMPQ